MNIDAPPFRIQLQAHIRGALARARDGAFALLRLVQGKGPTIKAKKKRKKKTEEGQEEKKDDVKEGAEDELLKQLGPWKNGLYRCLYSCMLCFDHGYVKELYVYTL